MGNHVIGNYKAANAIFIMCIHIWGKCLKNTSVYNHPRNVSSLYNEEDCNHPVFENWTCKWRLQHVCFHTIWLASILFYGHTALLSAVSSVWEFFLVCIFPADNLLDKYVLIRIWPFDIYLQHLWLEVG